VSYFLLGHPVYTDCKPHDESCLCKFGITYRLQIRPTLKHPSWNCRQIRNREIFIFYWNLQRSFHQTFSHFHDLCEPHVAATYASWPIWNLSDVSVGPCSCPWQAHRTASSPKSYLSSASWQLSITGLIHMRTVQLQGGIFPCDASAASFTNFLLCRMHHSNRRWHHRIIVYNNVDSGAVIDLRRSHCD